MTTACYSKTLASIVVATALTGVVAHPAPGAAQSSSTRGGSAQSGAQVPMLEVYQIMWVPIRTAEGVYGEGYDVGAAPAGDAGPTYTFERLDADGDGVVQMGEWVEPATGPGAERAFAE